MEYSFYKLLHIFAIILFLGNIITGLFWMWFAVRTKEVKIISHTIRGIILADNIFTTPGVIIIIATGVMAAMIGHFPILGTGWILWPIILFSISGVAFMSRVAPLQRSLAVFTSEAEASGNLDWIKFQSLYHSWELWGIVATVTPLAAAVMMVLKMPK
ncbi:MAG: DUF2269 family protein [Bacteriovoracaceae bacterium]|nr:DUF2269 domain-containing protein [Bacteroidota bacterium]